MSMNMKKKYKAMIYVFVLVVGFVFITGNILYAQTHTVTIKMNNDTVTALNNSGFYLYGFKAVKGTDGAARPLVWFRMEIRPNTSIRWSNQYQAYISYDNIVENVEILADKTRDIEPGQKLNVGDSGYCEVVKGKVTTAISFHNLTEQKYYTCGISQSCNSGAFTPYCAYPLYVGLQQIISPLEKVLLMFSTIKIKPGTVIEDFIFSTRGLSSVKAVYSPGILIDLTGHNERIVEYDIKKGGWNFDPIWTKKVSNADFVSELIKKD